MPTQHNTKTRYPMLHVLLNTQNQQHTQYPIGLLIKQAALKKDNLQKFYGDPLWHAGISDPIVALSLQYPATSKAPSKTLQREYLDQALKALNSLGVHTILCADGHYFKTLTNQKKAEPHYGYVLPCKMPGYEHMNVVLSMNYEAAFYRPDDVKPKISMSVDTLAAHLKGTYKELGADIIVAEHYPDTDADIEEMLNYLHLYPEITCDIEAFSLKFWEAGIGTIAFAWSQHEGCAFTVDYVPAPDHELYYGLPSRNESRRALLRRFLETYQGIITWQNINYDAKVLVYELWMRSSDDYNGMLTGIEVMTRHFHDTKLIAYLATNSCAGNKLSLKDLAHEFAGNYAQEDIKDIRLIPQAELLRYNLVDALSTWYVKNTYTPIMEADQQSHVYDTIMRPSVAVILQMELVGMPLDMARVREVQAELTAIQTAHLDAIRTEPLVERYNREVLRPAKREKDYQDRLKAQQQRAKERAAAGKPPSKLKPLEYKDLSVFQDECFNPGSNQQLGQLLHDLVGLPVIETTDTGQPAVGADELNDLKNHTQDPAVLSLLDNLVEWAGVSKILGTFIKAFIENSHQKPNGWYHLHGSFNLGGTQSGRLSSSSPNLQNLPSGSQYGKMVKSCFAAPPATLQVDRQAWADIMAPLKDTKEVPHV